MCLAFGDGYAIFLKPGGRHIYKIIMRKETEPRVDNRCLSFDWLTGISAPNRAGKKRPLSIVQTARPQD